MTAQTKLKRTMAVLLAATLALGLVPSAAYAASGDAFLDEAATDAEALAPSEDGDDASSWRFAVSDDDASMPAESAAEAFPADDGIEPLANVTVAGTKITMPSYVRKPLNATRIGIDVSEHNGKINWSTVKAAGVQFAIIRCGYGQDYSSQHDDRWLDNVRGAVRAGIPYGVYLYSYADSVAKAQGEADHMIRLLKESGCKPEFPVYYDLEESALASWTKAPLLAEMAFAFCSKVSAAGYTPAIYANTNWFNNYLTDPVFDGWGRWVAQYNATCTYKGTYQMWQCTSDGYVPGLSGSRGRADLNYELSNSCGQLGGRTGLQMVEGSMVFLDRSGSRTTGWQTIGGKTYYFDASGAMVTGEQTIDGKRLMFSRAGALEGAWVQQNGAWYLRDQNDCNKTGWQYVKGAWYFFDYSTGRMKTGWVKTGGKWYFFKDSGTMALGWVNSGGAWYYQGKSGAMVTGWQSIGGKRYYFSSSGAMKTGWLQRGQNWYHLSSSGALDTGWQKISGKWYYLNGGSGAMATGWKKLSGTWFYLKDSGAMAEGWVCVDGRWYYLTPGSGAMRTGWLRLAGTWYYLTGSGAMKTGWLKQGSTWYYLMPGSGAMAAGTTLTINGTNYRFDTSGAWV